jgi:hypothetical protein
MNTDATDLAERLSAEFDTMPATTVIRVVTECVDEWPDADVQFIEQAARSRLKTVPRAGR